MVASQIEGEIESAGRIPPPPAQEDAITVTQATPKASRNTRQRGEVLALLREVEGFHSAQHLHQMLLARRARVGLTTVYRTLQMLVDAGEIDSTRLPGGEQLFRRCSQSKHHHHLVCRDCGRTVEVAGPAVERWADQLAAQHGFTDVGHTLEIFGSCAECSR
ncbi:transcriptional repressor [Micromonospora sp. NBC_01655]|uniref:Fur family transcriptional regulator n=1 Tax=Micromonospora sp. NBC_01655 TaxID=2975983 RepID=UPI00225374C8|nr:transcriptional repressor [Micromonospora sp. NBC_01655]MCX4471361.1 transcriptional repressor [Micromonospora sp. NBC_01655]